MARKIKNRERVTTVTYGLFYSDNSEGSCGLMFDCDESGEIFRDKLNPCALANLEKIESGQQAYFYSEIQRMEWTYMDPAVILCDCCNDPVELDGFTNTCNCGADYNMSGDLLADRSQWGDDTGETLSDILRIR